MYIPVCVARSFFGMRCETSNLDSNTGSFGILSYLFCYLALPVVGRCPCVSQSEFAYRAIIWGTLFCGDFSG